jgi:multidrug transporter EmrE-like cation transporter
LKFAQYHYIRTDAGYVEFLTSAFSISFFFGIIILGIRILLKKETLHYKNILAGILLGILNWFSTLFFLKGLGQMDVSVFIPVFNAGLVSAAALVGLFIFKEPLSKINVLGILFSIIAITLIAYAN